MPWGCGSWPPAQTAIGAFPACCKCSHQALLLHLGSSQQSHPEAELPSQSIPILIGLFLTLLPPLFRATSITASPSMLSAPSLAATTGGPGVHLVSLRDRKSTSPWPIPSFLVHHAQWVLGAGFLRQKGEEQTASTGTGQERVAVCGPAPAYGSHSIKLIARLRSLPSSPPTKCTHAMPPSPR